jgi:predicted nucleic acid-binding protein
VAGRVRRRSPRRQSPTDAAPGAKLRRSTELELGLLFDTDAISELLRRRPAKEFVTWLTSIPREEQYTSAIVVGELFEGAFRSADAERHLRNIEQRILPAVTVLAYDVGVAREFGRLRAGLEEARMLLPDADIQIAATSIFHRLTLVTGNLRHFERFDGLDVSTVLADARAIKRRR